MTARPIIPGKAYRVTGQGFTATVLAENAAAAIMAGIDILIALKGD